ncbi:MAG: S8 family serine peptidase [Kiritimatiellia bacterium]
MMQYSVYADFADGCAAVRPDKTTINRIRRIDKQVTALQKLPKTVSSLSSQHLYLAEKLDAGLLKTWCLAANVGPQAAVEQMKKRISVAGNNEDLVVVIRLTVNADPQAAGEQLKNLGAFPVRVGNDVVKAITPIGLLDDIARLEGVGRIRSLLRPRHKSGSIVTEGVSLTFAEAWHAAGHTGLGVKVAVIDSEYANLTTLQVSGDLPADAVEYNLSSSGMTYGSYSHGCACAEIIHDMAPDARLYLIKVEDATDLVEAVSYCEAQGIDVISCSLGFDALNFHDGTAQKSWYTTVANHPVSAVNQAGSAGIFWAAAAGNEQLQHTLIDWSDADGDGSLDWDSESNNLNCFWLNGSDLIPAGSEFYIMLTWNHWPLSSSDFNLYLYRCVNSTWEYCTSSEEIQDGGTTSFPFEEIYYEAPEEAYYGIIIEKAGTVSSAKFILRYYGVDEPDYFSYDEMFASPPGSLCIPADAESAFTVGALDEIDYLTGPIEWFSSLGPNNRAYTGGTAVKKPDICGPDRVSCVTYSSGFAGTSASTPHIGGLAALIRSAYPDYTLADIKQYLENNAYDLGSPGKDNTYGAGAAQLGTAPEIPPIVQSAPLLENNGDAILEWTSFANRTYKIYWTSNLLEEFTLIQSNIPATPPMNTYTDDVSGLPASFWKIESN